MSARASTMTLNEVKERVPCLAGGAGEGGGVTMEHSRGYGARATLHGLTALWALGAWAPVNALFVQLPLLVHTAPEGWALPAGMALAVQAANAGPLLYAAMRRARAARPMPDAALIAALLAAAAAALLLNAQLHAVTVPLAGRARSLPFLALTWLAALCGCTSGVLCYPYLRRFREVYLTTYLVGEGLGGLVPSLLALAQGAGGEPSCEGGLAVYPPPRFSSATYLTAMGALVAGSCGAFVSLHRLRAFAAERVPERAAAKGEEAAPRVSLGSPRWLALLALTTLLNALLNGVLPGVQSFVCMPYGARAYHLAAALGAAASPAACLVGVWAAPLGARALVVLLAAGVAPLALLLAMAVLGRPLLAGPAGAALVVSTWLLAVSLISYARMWCMVFARSGGSAALRAAGGATQAGSALGSALMFLLVSYSTLFPQPSLCPQTFTIANNATTTTGS